MPDEKIGERGLVYLACCDLEHDVGVSILLSDQCPTV